MKLENAYSHPQNRFIGFDPKIGGQYERDSKKALPCMETHCMVQA